MAELVRHVILCPGCGGGKADLVGRDGSAFSTIVGTHEYVQPEYQVRRCRDCGLAFKSATLRLDELDRYYADVDFQKWEIPGLFPTERLVLDRLRSLPAGGRILDIGCSTGRMLSRLARDYRCHGVEINPQAASQAASKGLIMLDPHGWADPDANLLFDAVVAVDLFEHLSAPTAFLTAAVGRLAPGGWLIVCTGDMDVPAVAGDPAFFWYFRTVEHLVMMTRTYAEFVAERTGVRLVRWDHVTHYDSTPSQRFRQWLQAVVYESIHLGRYRPLGRILRVMPAGRKAVGWTHRPPRTLTADHVVAVFEKPMGRS